jgi:hypothetical protein
MWCKLLYSRTTPWEQVPDNLGHCYFPSKYPHGLPVSVYYPRARDPEHPTGLEAEIGPARANGLGVYHHLAGLTLNRFSAALNGVQSNSTGFFLFRVELRYCRFAYPELIVIEIESSAQSTFL